MDAGQTLGPCRGTRLVGMPWLFTMVAEIHSASWTLAVKLWTAGASTRYYSIPKTHTDTNDVVLESGSILESDSSPHFEDSE